MTRKNARKRSAAYWQKQYTKANNKLIICRSTRRTEGWQSIISEFIKWSAFAFIAYNFIVKLPEILAPLAGKDTRFDATIDIFGPDPWMHATLILIVAICFLIFSNRNLRKTNKHYIEKYSPYQKIEEEKAFEHRSSSELNSDGSTRREDK